MRRLKKVHLCFALIIGVFIASHLIVHLTALISSTAHQSALRIVQIWYRNPIIEPVLILALISQICIGISLLKNRSREDSKSLWAWAQILSGVYLALFLVIHTSAAFLTRYVTGIDTNFFWVASTLEVAPYKYFFALYYFLGVQSVFVHIAAALHFGRSKRSNAIPILVVLVGLLLAAVILMSFGGLIYEIKVPDSHKVFSE